MGVSINYQTTRPQIGITTGELACRLFVLVLDSPLRLVYVLGRIWGFSIDFISIFPSWFILLSLNLQIPCRLSTA
jgi:hypothetical protein